MISICEVPPEPPEDVGLESLLAPVPGTEPNSILFDQRDGGDVLSLEAHRLLYRRNDEELAKASDVRISLFVTAARFALACTKYVKGRGLAGAMHSRGKCLVGQVRYQSLHSVGSTRKRGRLQSLEALVLSWHTSAEEEHFLRLDLDKGYTAAEWAATIARRAARYRLAAEQLRATSEVQLSDEERARLEELVDVEPFRDGFEDGKTYRLHPLPGPWFETQQSAAIGVQLTAAEIAQLGR